MDRVMTPLGVSRNRLARDIDVPVGRVSELVAGKRSITPDTALRLAKYFGTSAELWLRLQWEYDLHQARMTRWPRVEERVRVLAPAHDGHNGAVIVGLDD
jgi:addiction module HigA family antidote